MLNKFTKRPVSKDILWSWLELLKELLIFSAQILTNIVIILDSFTYEKIVNDEGLKSKR